MDKLNSSILVLSVCVNSYIIILILFILFSDDDPLYINGDFNNDQLKVYGSSLVEQVIDLTIMSRNGHVVFNNKNFQADESQQGWDGTFRNEKAQQGVYILYVEYKDILGVVRQGIYSVTLAR